MGSTTRRTARGLAGLAVAASLAIALAVPAFASHEDDLELVAAGTGAGDECEGYDFAFKLDNMDQLSAGVYTASDENHTVWIEIELFESENEVNDYEILDADPAIDKIVAKQPNPGGGISHLTFCYDEDLPEESIPEESIPEESIPEESIPEESIPEESIPEESIPEESIPEESQPEGTPLGEQPTPAESEREGTLGGTPAPSGGTVPNTAAQPWTGVPASVLGLVLLASLGALVYVRLAQEPTER
jgi:hypothetical protein